MAASIRQRRPALGARILEHIFPWLLRPWLLHCICIKVMCQCRAAAAPPLSRNWNSKVSLDAISFCSIVPGQGHGGTLCRQVLAPGCSAAVLQSGDSEGRPVCHGGEEWHYSTSTWTRQHRHHLLLCRSGAGGGGVVATGARCAEMAAITLHGPDTQC